MTDERLAILALCERIYRFHPNEDTMAEWIATALAARERAVWMEAAKGIEERLYNSDEQQLADWCRQQAEAVKQIPTPEEE